MAEQNPDLQLKLNRLRELQGVRYAGASGIKPLPIGGLLGNAGVGDTPTMGSIELNKTLTGARGRILSDPVVARSADPSKLIADLERIAQGQPQESTSGVPNAFLSGAGKFLEGVGYGLNRPLALITSAAKEIADIPSGGFSANEFVSQALAKDTAPSKYIAKTGIDWVDNIIGFTADVVADPLTYVTFGAGAYAGRAGRLNLAAKAAEADNIIKAPTLLKKVNDGSIAKLGEWALDANERAVLGVRPGLSWAFGARQTIGKEGTTLAKLSEGAATAVGKPLAKVRGAIGASELPGITALQKVTTPKKIKIAGLEMYGRVAEEPAVVNRVADLASYSAGIRANAAGAFVEKKFGSQGQQLVKEIFDYEQATGRRVYEVLEKIRPAVDSAEQDLANRTRKFLDDMRAYANTTTGEFAGRRNVDAIGVAHRENYVPHTLTEDARKYVASQRWAGTSSASAIKQMLGMNVNEFTKGPGILRGRTLQQGQEWLDVPLKTNLGDGAATMAEINKISMDKLGFKWFEEDGAQYLSNYLDSIVNHTKRVAFVDRLFDYGGDVIKKLTLTRTPNKKLAKQWGKIIDGYDNMLAPVLRELAAGGEDLQSILAPRLELAQALVSLKPGSRILTDEQLDEIRQIFDATMGELAEGKRLVDLEPDFEVQRTYMGLLSGLQTKLDDINSALLNADEGELISKLGLREMHTRLLPDAEVPNDFKTMAENILDASEVYFSDLYKNTTGREVLDVLRPKKGEGFPGARVAAGQSPESTIRDYTFNESTFLEGVDPRKAAKRLEELTKYLKETSEPNRYQLFRGADQSPIEDIFKDAGRPGKPLSFSENQEITEQFGSKQFSYEPGELRGIPLNERDIGLRPYEEEFLVDPYSIVEATAKRFDPELAERLKGLIPELQQRVASTREQRDSVKALVDALRNKSRADSAKIAKESLVGLEKELDDLTAETKGMLTQKFGITEEQADAYLSWKYDEIDYDTLVKMSKDKDLKNIEMDKEDLLNQIQAAQRKAQYLQNDFDVEQVAWKEDVGWLYDDDIARIAKLVKKNPPPGTAGEVTAAWTIQTRRALKALKSAEMRLTPAELDLANKVVKQTKGLESRLAQIEADKMIAVEEYRKIVSGELAPKISSDVLKGWEAMESLGVQMPPEIRERMFAKVQQLGTPEGASQMRKMYDSYTRFFKVTAMLSPGFIVRNSYTAAFNNFVAGVSVKETADALKFATNILRFGVDEAMNKVPRQLRGLYEQSLKVAYATGAGQSYDDILAPILSKKGGSRFLNLKPVKKWSEANETAEVAFRFALGMSSLKKGMDFDAAVGTVARYHFDYTDLSRLDEVARQFIPFWIFASRNIPLQIINQIARPSVYRMYESVERNYGLSEEEMKDYPMWLRNRSPLRLPGMGADQTLIPDLPQLDMAEQINMMSDPMRLLSQANPLIKLPVELMGNRQLWNSVPFSEKKAPVSGPLDFPAYAIDAILGRSGKSPRTGEYFTSSKTAYALPNLLPPLAQLQRVFPKIPFTGVQLGGKDSYQSRQGSSFASYVGLPYRRVAPEEKFNELTRRQFAIRDYLSELTRRGQLEPKD